MVTEAGVVYLLGIVTEAEAEAATELARTTGGVRKVVKVFEYCKATDELCKPPPPPRRRSSPTSQRSACEPARRSKTRSATRLRLERWIGALPRPLVFTNGVFDLLHRGHVTYLAQARALGAALLVALNSDASVKPARQGRGPAAQSSGRPAGAWSPRWSAVDAVTWFDDDTPEALIAALPAARCWSRAATGRWSASSAAAEMLARGGRVVSIPFEHERSTTALLERIRRQDELELELEAERAGRGRAQVGICSREPQVTR